MKTTVIIAFLTCCLTHLTAEGVIGYPQKEESMARVQRLLMASVIELPADQWQKDLRNVGYQDLPAIKRFLEDEPYDNFTYQILISLVCKIDGSNLRSTGDTDILRMTREFLSVKSGNPDWQSAAYSLLYLSQKGLSSDLSLLEKYSTLPSKLPIEKQVATDSLNILNARVYGTNVLTGLQTRYYCWSTNEPPFLPSVANTGPQAAYIYDVLKQALAKYNTASNIPPELITMTVSFDANGKPVCSADLVKYGLVMPDIPPPKSPFPARSELTAAVVPAPTAAPSATVTNRPAMETPKPTGLQFHMKLGLGAGIACVLIAVGYFIRRRKGETR